VAVLADHFLHGVLYALVSLPTQLFDNGHFGLALLIIVQARVNLCGGNGARASFSAWYSAAEPRCEIQDSKFKKKSRQNNNIS